MSSDDTVTISRSEYEGLKRFRDSMAWYWQVYLAHRAISSRYDYEGYMVYHQIDNAPEARIARLAYWYQLAEKDSENE